MKVGRIVLQVNTYRLMELDFLICRLTAGERGLDNCPLGSQSLVILIIIIIIIEIIIIRQFIRRRNMSVKSLQGRRTAYDTRNEVVMYMTE